MTATVIASLAACKSKDVLAGNDQDMTRMELAHIEERHGELDAHRDEQQ